MVLCGISRCFHLLSPCLGQIVHALLPRPPLEYQPSGRNLPFDIPARLACVKHAASVRPEPGSNSDVQSLTCLPVSVHRLAKARQLQPSSKRFTHSNLTVSCTFRFSVSFSRIARCHLVSLADSLFSIAKTTRFVNPYFSFFTACLRFC